MVRSRGCYCVRLLFLGEGEYQILIFTNSTANACYKDAADLHADLDEYPQAIARYEQVADHSLTSALTKYSVKEYWLKAGLCALAMGVRTCSLNLNCNFLILKLGNPGHCNSETKYDQIFKPRCNIYINQGGQIYQCTYRSCRSWGSRILYGRCC